jgi:hypothetical protein
LILLDIMAQLIKSSNHQSNTKIDSIIFIISIGLDRKMGTHTINCIGMTYCFNDVKNTSHKERVTDFFRARHCNKGVGLSPVLP